MPFAGYDDFDDCVADNQGKSDPDAYCAAIKREIEGELSANRREILEQVGLQDVDPTSFEDVDACTLDLENRGIEDAAAICRDTMAQTSLAAPMLHDLAEAQDPGTIERVEESDGSVRYTDILLLAPGVWGDAGSGQRVYYSPRGIENSADNWTDTTVNLFHERENEVTDVGDVDTESIYLGDDRGGLYGDIVLHMDNAASEFADDALQNALETGGREGIQGPSVEMRGTDYEFDESRGVHELVEGVFNGLGLVGLGVSPGPGSKDAAFARQTADRAVALASDESATLLHHEPMTYEHTRTALQDTHDIQLGEDTPAETIVELATTLLQDGGEMAMVQDLIEQARQEGFDLADQSAAELRAFITDTLDPSEDALAAFDDIADAYLETVEGDSLDVTPAEAMLDFIVEQAGTEEGDEPDDGDEEDGEEMAEQLADLAETVDSMEDRLSTLAEETEPFREADTTLSDLTERFEDYASAETVDEIETRLSELEDTLEAPTSLADVGVTEPTDDEDVTAEPWGATPTGLGSFSPTK